MKVIRLRPHKVKYENEQRIKEMMTPEMIKLLNKKIHITAKASRLRLIDNTKLTHS